MNEVRISSPRVRGFRRFLGVVRWFLFIIALVLLVAGLAAGVFLLTQGAMPSLLLRPARAFTLSFTVFNVGNLVQAVYEARRDTEVAAWVMRFFLRSLIGVIPLVLVALTCDYC
jgi:hypothetical protein